MGSLKRALLSAFVPNRIEPKTVLNDVSFTVPHGQTLAIIGRNGSGKSTLLGILARVYRQTAGAVALSGPDGAAPRIAPLLDLDAGFHPDLTGIENVSFFGTVLGLTVRQVRERFDSIVRFAELEGKMDTFLRGWNQGAKLRLGFAIAVHIDPDILLVDEVLAVGDESFQNKCYRLIAEMQAEGKTIVFVSHDLDVVERVASRVIWMNEGVIVEDGETHAVLEKYRAASAKQ